MIKTFLLFLLLSLPLADNVFAGGNDECVVNTDCRFVWVAIDSANHVTREATAVVVTGSADMNIGWLYEDDDALTDLADANEVDEATACSSEIPASGVCMELVSATRGLYVFHVDSLLINESGKEFCLDVADGYATTRVDDAVLCKYVSLIAKHSEGFVATVAGSPAATTTSFASTAFSNTSDDAYIGYPVTCGDATRVIARFDNVNDEVFFPLGDPFPSAPSGDCTVRSPGYR